MAKSLLDKAKERQEIRKLRMMSHEELELARAYILGDVSLTQVNYALGYPSNANAGYSLIARAVRILYRSGQLKVR